MDDDYSDKINIDDLYQRKREIDQLKLKVFNGFSVAYTHPNLLFISWAHYYDKSKRMDIKKEYGVNVDGFGNLVKSKNNENKKNTTPGDMNSLMFNKADVKVGAENQKKDYKQISTYKPTGNLIYNNALLKKIHDKTN